MVTGHKVAGFTLGKSKRGGDAVEMYKTTVLFIYFYTWGDLPNLWKTNMI